MLSRLSRCSHSSLLCRAASKRKTVIVFPKAKNNAIRLLNSSTSSDNKSWVPVAPEALQKVTMQSLIHEIAEQQKELATKVSPCSRPGLDRYTIYLSYFLWRHLSPCVSLYPPGCSLVPQEYAGNHHLHSFKTFYPHLRVPCLTGLSRYL